MLRAISFIVFTAVFLSIIYLHSHERNYHQITEYFRPKTKMDIQNNNLSKYIRDFTSTLDSPEKKIEEKRYLLKTLLDRKQIAKMLPRMNKLPFHTTFHILVDNTKKRIGQKYDMIILVSSYSLHFERRRMIREIWGNTSLSLNKNWKVFFITGGVKKESGMKILYNETIQYNDVIIEDFMESYTENMGKKVMTALQWANANFKYDYILKCDDDVFVDVDSILAVLHKMNEKLIYLGNLMVGSVVMRSGRWGLSVKEYPDEKYKPYCSGGGFVLSKLLVERMIPKFKWEHPLRIDDAYIGEVVAQAGGHGQHHQGFKMWNDHCVYSDDILVSHHADRTCMLKMQRKVLEKKKNYL